MRRTAIALTAILLIAGPTRAEVGPCKPDQFKGLICGEGIGAARVIDGTMSPSKRLAFAWRSLSSAPQDLLTDRQHYDLESLVIRLADGAVLSKLPGEYWNTGKAYVNRYDLTTAWSPDSRYAVEILNFRWSTEQFRLYAIGADDKALVLDLKPVMEPPVRKYLGKDEGLYAFAIYGGKDGNPPMLTIDNRGRIKTTVLMEKPKQGDAVTLDVTAKVVARDGALSLRDIKIRHSKVEP